VSRTGLRHRPFVGALLGVAVVGIFAGGCSASDSGSPATSTTVVHESARWIDPTSTVSVQWTDGAKGVKSTTYPPGSITTFAQSMPEQRLVEHVTSEYNSSAALQVGFMRLFAQTCFGTSVTWEGHPGIRCSGSYRPLDPGKVAFETIRTLGVSEYSDALQSVLVVGVSPTHLYIVDAVATSKSALAVGSMFVLSFDVLMPHEA